MGQSAKCLHFSKASSSLVCTFMLIPGKEIVFPYFLRISLLQFYCLGAVGFHIVFSVLFPATFYVCEHPPVDVFSWKYYC